MQNIPEEYGCDRINDQRYVRIKLISVKGRRFREFILGGIATNLRNGFQEGGSHVSSRNS